jgi:imidazolonepropionase-like amidohydrolase
MRTVALLAALGVFGAGLGCRRGGPTSAEASVSTGWPLDADLVIDHVEVVPMDAERVLPDQVVVVRDRRVVAVGPAGSAPSYAKAIHVQGGGRWLVPGLFDMHTHFVARPRDPTTDGREADIQLVGLAVRAGITSVMALCESTAQLELRDAIGRGEVLGPRMAVSNRCLEDATMTEAQGEAVVQSDRQAGFDFFKVYNGLSADGFAGILRAAHQTGMPVVGHIPTVVGTRAAAAGGMDDIAHIEELLYNAPFRLQYNDDGDDAVQLDPTHVPEVVQLLRGAGTYVTTTLVAYKAILDEATDLDAALNHACSETPPSARFFFHWDKERNSRAHRLGAPRALSRVQAGWSFERRLTKALVEGGVPLMAGTDAPALPGDGLGCGLHRELALLVEAGLTPYEALRAATAVPGGFFAQKLHGERAGVVDVGARADLVLLSRNPLADISALDSIVGVVLDGTWRPQALPAP